MILSLMTLCIVHRNNQVLLGMKKRGFGEGHWNGFGGKVLENETIEEAAIREIHEEAGITPKNLFKLGLLNFTFSQNDQKLQVHIYKCTQYEGTVGESEEMRPQWFAEDSVPFDLMWKDDVFWFPFFLQNKKFEGRFHFDERDEILESELREMENLIEG